MAILDPKQTPPLLPGPIAGSEVQVNKLYRFVVGGAGVTLRSLQTRVVGVLATEANKLAEWSALNWVYHSQEAPVTFAAGIAIPLNVETDQGSIIYRRTNASALTGATFSADLANWTARSATPGAGIRVDLTNFAASGSAGLASATVDTPTHLTFTQTTANITVQLATPTTPATHKTITLENLPMSTQAINVTGVAGTPDTIALGVNEVREIAWNGTAWRAVAPANLLAENLGKYGTEAFVNVAGFGTQMINLPTTIFKSGVIDYADGTFGLTAGDWLCTLLEGDVDNNVNEQQLLFHYRDGIAGNTGGGTFGSFYLKDNAESGQSGITLPLKVPAGGYRVGWNTVRTPADGYPKTITFQKISGNTQITGQSAEHGVFSVASNTALAVGNGIGAATLVSGNIPFTPGLSNGSTPALFTLKAGRTYRLNAAIYALGTPADTSGLSVEWTNFSGGTSLHAATTGSALVLGSQATTSASATPFATVIYTPIVDTQVFLKYVGAFTGNVGTVSTRTQIEITQIGSTPTTPASLPVVQRFTASGTYTPTPGMLWCEVEMVGGGGGGGGWVNATANQHGGGGGGGAGGYVKALLTAAQVGASQAVTIGAGGTGSTGSGVNGAATTLGALLTAGGGTGSASSGTSAGNIGLVSRWIGGAGGTVNVATGANVSSQTGQQGQFSFTSQGSNWLSGWGGRGAASVLGQNLVEPAGFQAPTNTAGSVTGTAAPANSGAGGGGGYGCGNFGSVSGGNGGTGLMIIKEFFFQ
jgi:hypothetical protein